MVPKMLTPEQRDTWLIVDGELITMADQAVDFLHNMITVSQLNSIMTGQWLAGASEVIENVMEVLTEASKVDFRECFQKLYECCKSVAVPKGAALKRILYK